MDVKLRLLVWLLFPKNLEIWLRRLSGGRESGAATGTAPLNHGGGTQRCYTQTLARPLVWHGVEATSPIHTPAAPQASGSEVANAYPGTGTDCCRDHARRVRKALGPEIAAACRCDKG